jgi:hypothetical protein
MFEKATKNQIKIRLAISGASGGGKTYSSLAIATHLAKPIALIDTERGSSKKYADKFDFDVCELTDFHPARYIEAIKYAENAGYQTIIIDSLSHAWYAELELSGKSFDGWAKVRPLERKLIDATIGSKSHIIATMRSKTEYIFEAYVAKDGKTKQAPKKIGTAPIQTNGIEYEFDIAADIDYNHILTITKSRCSELTDRTFLNPGSDLAAILNEWIEQPWKNWNQYEDAIDWAARQLPEISRSQLSAEFDSLEASNGKKALAWVEYVNQLANNKAIVEYKKLL